MIALEHWISRRQPGGLASSEPVPVEAAAADPKVPPRSAPSAGTTKLARLLGPSSRLVPESLWALIDLIRNPAR